MLSSRVGTSENRPQGEEEPTTLPAIYQSTIWTRHRRDTPNRRRKTLPFTSDIARWSSWHRLLLDFGSRNLTCSSEVQSTLSDVAWIFAADLEDEYMAGIWKRDFRKGLLWSVRYCQTTSGKNRQQHEESRQLLTTRPTANSNIWPIVELELKIR